MGGGPHVAPPPTGSGGIQQPMTLNLYPETSSADGSRLFIKVTAVGTASVDMPLAFDTGSAGPVVQQPSTAESVSATSPPIRSSSTSRPVWKGGSSAGYEDYATPLEALSSPMRRRTSEHTFRKLPGWLTLSL